MTKREASEPLVNRERIPLSIALDLFEWVEDHSRAGGPFGWPSHAYELALFAIRREMEHLSREAKKRGQDFQPETYWKLHAADVARTLPGKTGPPKRGEAEPGVERRKTFASVEASFLEWAYKHCIKDGPLQSMSQAVEFGLLLLQEDERRWREAAPKAGLPYPAALWTLYEQAAKGKAGTRRAS